LIELNRVLSETRQRLAAVSETGALDAQVLLAYVLAQPRSWILAHPDAQLDKNQLAHVESLISRLESGEPLPYIIGHWEFYSLDFILTPAVLIPRPETEMLVEHALHWLVEHPARRDILDVGTGSGCIAVALA
jgi:release factor glutamine methyltransferase